MQSVIVSAHFEGERIVLDEPLPMKPDTKLLVAVLPQDDDERSAWLHLSSERLEAAYGDDEPDYALPSIRELNLGYPV